ncbi:MAG: LuxR C-terminal-related transcriptional regulator [Bergeyella zoohelcum]|nr:LuxR C-terminal-related transcriptional regulator [Bergeyella zoohelcum]
MENNIDYQSMIKAFARVTYKSLYVVNYESKTFEFVAKNPLFLCGLSSDEVQKMGYSFYFKKIKKEDLEILFITNKICKEFFRNIPIDEKIHYSVSYDFHLQDEKGKYILVNQKITPLSFSNEGNVVLALCLVELSRNSTAGNIIITKDNSENYWIYDLSLHQWKSYEKIKLNDREMEILRLYAQGLTIKEISKRIYISESTIKFHRKNIFQKLKVETITEALTYMMDLRLL